MTSPRIRMRTIDGATADARRREGREVRADVPREALGAWSAADRDPVAVIEGDEQGLVADLVPIRHARMAASPFAFLRGTAGLMALDLSRYPTSGIPVQLCGDAHISNFGLFATPERSLVFDVNDFDETHVGPFDWDVRRLAASAAVAARENGLGTGAQLEAATTAAAEYRKAALQLAGERFIDVWFSQVQAEQLFSLIASQARKRGRAEIRKSRKRLARDAAKRTSLGSLSKLATETPEGWRLRERPPVIVRYPHEERVDAQLRDLFARYRASLSRDRHVLLGHYHLADFARKVVGIGSVGTEAFMFLLMGTRPDDPLFLQLKEARASALATYLDAPSVIGTDPIAHEGERVVTGQRLLQSASDPFLGWAVGGSDDAQHFYLRQLRDMKVSAVVEEMDRRHLLVYTALCARILARAHARSGSITAVAGYLGRSDAFENAIAGFAMGYADQTWRDHGALVAAIASGRLQAMEA